MNDKFLFNFILFTQKETPYLCNYIRCF